MAFKIWCETPLDLNYTLGTLEDDCGFDIHETFNPSAPVGIIVRLNKIKAVDRNQFDADSAEVFSIMDDYWPDSVETYLEDGGGMWVTFLKNGGGIWVSNSDDLDEFVNMVSETYSILNKPPKAPCGFYLANPETLAWANNTTHAKQWKNYANGEMINVCSAKQAQALDRHDSVNYGAEVVDAVNHPRQTESHGEDDSVNHPRHYANSCSLECIDVMRTVFGDEYTAAGCLFNTFKYLWRYKHKGHPEEDLAKANWYFDRAEDLIPNVEYNDALAEISIRLMNLMEECDL